MPTGTTKNALRAALRSANVHFDAVLDCICFNAAHARVDISVLPEFTSHVIVISTDSLYSPEGKRVPQNEDGKYMTGESYGALKRQMEEVFLKECPENLRYTLFRPPHMYGAGSELGCFPLHTRQKNLLECMRCGESIKLVEGGIYLIQPLYVGDLAKAMVSSIRNEKTYNQIFCIAGPDVIENREYFEILGDIIGLPVAIESVSKEEYLNSHDDGYLYFCHRVYDLSRLREAGLPVPSVGIREGLREQVEYLLKQGR